MKLKLACTLAATCALLFPPAAVAADDVHRLPFDRLLQSADGQQLDPGIKLYLAGQPAPKPTATRGEFVSNKKTNAFGKSVDATCHRAGVSALLSLQERARPVGADAVINIVSYYKKVPMSSATDYECHVGAIMSGVAFQGTMVTLGR